MSQPIAPESTRQAKSAESTKASPQAPSLRAKIFYSLFGLVAVVEILVFGLVFLVADTIGQKWAYEHLEQESQKLATQMHNTDYLAFWGQYPYRISLIAESGAVVYDNRVNVAELDNHKDREEVRAALAQGHGYMERKSTSTKYKALYYARYLPEYHLIVRISMSQRDVHAFFLPVLGYMGVILALTLVLSALLARYLTRSIIAPLNTLSALDSKGFSIPYGELAPFFTKIIAQKKQLKKQLKIIRRQQQQFQAISQNINEGVVLLDSKKTILSYNERAKELVPYLDSRKIVAPESNAPDSGERDSRALGAVCNAPDSRVIDSSAQASSLESKSHAIQSDVFGFIDFSLAQIQTSELQIEHKHIECIALPIWGKARPKAFAVLLLDRSQIYQIQAMRREFSANVTHELKTPLSVIMASSEMMKQGLIAEKDFMTFVDKIHEECKRLLEIINDILKLSFFDEGGSELERVPVRLYDIAQLVLNALAPLSESKQLRVKLMCDGLDSHVLGAPHLLQDMLYNLCENAIKYNKDGGELEVRICSARLKAQRWLEVDFAKLAPESPESQKSTRANSTPKDPTARRECVPESCTLDSGLQDSNAIDLSALTPITPRATLPQDLLLLVVRDSGIGIPSDEIARVFERFYRVDKSRSKKLGGTGLGLSIVKHIALYHGAHMFVRSELEKGSEVLILFER